LLGHKHKSIRDQALAYNYAAVTIECCLNTLILLYKL